MKELIIAAYNRDYHYWVSNLNPDVKITVYRKGANLNNENEIYLENNVGRDVHTFFYHIVNRYESLLDYTITSQDFPFDHVSNYTDIINGSEYIWNKTASQIFSECWFFCTQYPVLDCDKMGSPHHTGLDIEPVWNLIFKDDCPTVLNFTPTGHFCVSKNHIHKRPLSFYKNILSILETNEQAPWIIERLERYIFDLSYTQK
jgi:hypothetical protein